MVRVDSRGVPVSRRSRAKRTGPLQRLSALDLRLTAVAKAATKARKAKLAAKKLAFTKDGASGESKFASASVRSTAMEMKKLTDKIADTTDQKTKARTSSYERGPGRRNGYKAARKHSNRSGGASLWTTFRVGVASAARGVATVVSRTANNFVLPVIQGTKEAVIRPLLHRLTCTCEAQLKDAAKRVADLEAHVRQLEAAEPSTSTAPPSVEAAPAPQQEEPSRSDPRLAKFQRMLSVGVPRGAVEQKMRAEGLEPSCLDTGVVEDATESASAAAAPVDSRIAPFKRMLAVGVPRGAVEQKMRLAGLDPKALDDASVAAASSDAGSASSAESLAAQAAKLRSTRGASGGAAAKSASADATEGAGGLRPVFNITDLLSVKLRPVKGRRRGSVKEEGDENDAAAATAGSTARAKKGSPAKSKARKALSRARSPGGTPAARRRRVPLPTNSQPAAMSLEMVLKEGLANRFGSNLRNSTPSSQVPESPFSDTVSVPE